MLVALRRYDNRCAMPFCRIEFYDSPEKPNLDHILPLMWGGSEERYNLRPLCSWCRDRLNLFGQCSGAVSCAMSTPRGKWRTNKLWEFKASE